MKVAIFAALGVIVAAQPTSDPLPQCQQLTIPVTISGIQQKDFKAPINHSTYNSSYASLPDLTVSGTYNISASLCGPTSSNARRNAALQILVHGGSYNKTYWSGLQTPPQSINGSTYSWVNYAASQGYYTLAIDRLCNGDSSRPDGVNICQAPAEAAVIHQLVLSARNGTLGTRARRRFSTVLYVGHSLGSQLGSYYLNKYSGDIDAAILSGFTRFPDGGALTYSNGVRPARDTLARYSMLEPTYVMGSDPNTTRTTFYYGSYNLDISSLDYEGSGTVAYGEFKSFSLGVAVQPNIRIPMFLLNGQQDAINCPSTPVTLLYGTGGECGSGDTSLTALTKALYPNAATFSYYNVPNTGHCLNLHYSAPMAFAAAHRFLNSLTY